MTSLHVGLDSVFGTAIRYGVERVGKGEVHPRTRAQRGSRGIARLFPYPRR